MLSPELTVLLMALLLVLTVFALSRPWWGQRNNVEAGRRAVNIATYRQRIAEIEQEQASGILDAEIAAQLKAEQGARLLADTEPAEAPANTTRRAAPWWGLLVLIPVLATGLYLYQDRWIVAKTAEVARLDPAAGEQLALSRALAARETAQQAQPDDAQGWAMLGQLRMASGDASGAAQAFARANALLPDQPDWWVAEAEALAAGQQQNLQGGPAERIEKALALAPDHGKALFYGGMVAAQRGDLAQARARWTQLLAGHELPADLRQVIARGIEGWGGTVAAGADAVTVTVRLPAGGTPPADRNVLWVFARAVDGPPMPVAVKRIASPQFPLTVTLGDGDAVMPGGRLSALPTVAIIARLGSGEDVQAQPGDLQAQGVLDRADADTIDLTLDTRVGG